MAAGRHQLDYGRGTCFVFSVDDLTISNAAGACASSGCTPGHFNFSKLLASFSSLTETAEALRLAAFIAPTRPDNIEDARHRSLRPEAQASTPPAAAAATSVEHAEGLICSVRPTSLAPLQAAPSRAAVPRPLEGTSVDFADVRALCPSCSTEAAVRSTFQPPELHGLERPAFTVEPASAAAPSLAAAPGESEAIGDAGGKRMPLPQEAAEVPPADDIAGELKAISVVGAARSSSAPAVASPAAKAEIAISNAARQSDASVARLSASAAPESSQHRPQILSAQATVRLVTPLCDPAPHCAPPLAAAASLNVATAHGPPLAAAVSSSLQRMPLAHLGAGASPSATVDGGLAAVGPSPATSVLADAAAGRVIVRASESATAMSAAFDIRTYYVASISETGISYAVISASSTRQTVTDLQYLAARCLQVALPHTALCLRATREPQGSTAIPCRRDCIDAVSRSPPLPPSANLHGSEVVAGRWYLLHDSSVILPGEFVVVRVLCCSCASLSHLIWLLWQPITIALCIRLSAVLLQLAHLSALRPGRCKTHLPTLLR